MLIVQLTGYTPVEIAGYEREPLIVKGFADGQSITGQPDQVVASIPAPSCSWSAKSLVDAVDENWEAIYQASPAEFYLGDLWIGSTEL
jgi:hypothetical protein